MAPPGEIILRPSTADVAALDGARFGEGGIIRVETVPLLDPVSGVVFNGSPGLSDLIASADGVSGIVGHPVFGDSPLSSLSGNAFDNPHGDLTNPGVRGFYDGVLRLLGWGPTEMPTQVMSVHQVNELRQASLGPDADAITVVIEDPQLADLLRQMDPNAEVTMVGNYPAVNGERLLATLRAAGAGPGREIMLPMAARLSPQVNAADLRAVEDRAIRMALLTRVAGPLVREEVIGLSGFTPPTLHEPITSVRLVNPTDVGGDPSGNYRLVVSTREDPAGGVSGGTVARDRLTGELERMINQGPLPDEFRNWEGMTATRDPNNPGRLIVTRGMDFRGTDGVTDHRDVTFFIDVESH